MKSISNDEQRTIQMNVLRHFVSLCEKNDFKYYVIDGTLLGTIRHKGYIPWDDDIDVAMPRNDYDRFLQEYRRINNDNRIKMISRDINPLYHMAFAKLYDAETVVKERRVRKKYQNIYGIYIDIFPLDHIPSDVKKRKRIVTLNYYLSKIISMNVIGLEVKHNSLLAKGLYTLLFYLQRPFPIKHLTLIQEKIIKKCNSHNQNSHLLKELAFQDVNSEQFFLEEDFDEHIFMPFEDIPVRVPIGYKRILKSLYGNYMELPPENERTTHGIDAHYV